MFSFKPKLTIARPRENQDALSTLAKCFFTPKSPKITLPDTSIPHAQMVSAAPRTLLFAK